MGSMPTTTISAVLRLAGVTLSHMLMPHAFLEWFSVYASPSERIVSRAQRVRYFARLLAHTPL